MEKQKQNVCQSVNVDQSDKLLSQISYEINRGTGKNFEGYSVIQVVLSPCNMSALIIWEK